MVRAPAAAVVAAMSIRNGNNSCCSLFIYGTLMAPEVLDWLLSGKKRFTKVDGAENGVSQAAEVLDCTTDQQRGTKRLKLTSHTNSQEDSSSMSPSPSIAMFPARLVQDKIGGNSYQRYPIRNAVFPALYPITQTDRPHGRHDTLRPVQGMYLPVVTLGQLRILDFFEDVGHFYERRSVQVELLEESVSLASKSESEATKPSSSASTAESADSLVGRIRSCEAYIYTGDSDILAMDQGDWDYQAFRDKHLTSFLENAVEPTVKELHSLGYYDYLTSDKTTNDEKKKDTSKMHESL